MKRITREDVKREIMETKFPIFGQKFWTDEEAGEFLKRANFEAVLYELGKYDKQYGTHFAEQDNFLYLANSYYYICAEEVYFPDGMTNEDISKLISK